jgi:hypothetical protein
MHMFIRPTARGGGWYADRSSRMPVPLGGTGQAWTGVWDKQLDPLVQLTVRRVEETYLGRFDGLVVSYEDFHTIWMMHDRPANGQISFQRIMLDAVTEESAQEHDEPREFRTMGHKRDMWPGTEMDQLSSWLLRRYMPTDLMVLRLGSRGKDADREVVGMIVCRAESIDCGIHYWQRLGFCYWICKCVTPYDQAAQDVLDEKDDAVAWQRCIGYSG